MILFINSFFNIREDKFPAVAEKISYILYLHKEFVLQESQNLFINKIMNLRHFYVKWEL